MKALAYLDHDTSNTVTCDPPEGKEEPAQQWFWDVERTCRACAEEVYQLKRDIKSLLG
jgi:hypothetical protein